MSAKKLNRGLEGADRKLSRAATHAIHVLTTLGPPKICIKAHHGHLDLNGRVSSAEERLLIEEVTRGLPGVRGVSNFICVEADPSFDEVRGMG